MKTTQKIYSIAIVCLMGLTSAHATSWIKDAATECMLWNPNPQKHETIIWSGDISEGKAHGYGTATWKVRGTTTEHAEGEWVKGRLHGVAVWTHTDGSTYEGQWQNGQKSGYGIYTWPNGTLFMGEYRNDQRKLGRLINADGKQTEIIQPSLARELSYKAQDASILARKAATRARLENTKRIQEIQLSSKAQNQSEKKDQATAEQGVEIKDTPVEDPSEK